MITRLATLAIEVALYPATFTFSVIRDVSMIIAPVENDPVWQRYAEADRLLTGE